LIEAQVATSAGIADVFCPRKASTVAEINRLLWLHFLKEPGALYPVFLIVWNGNKCGTFSGNYKTNYKTNYKREGVNDVEIDIIINLNSLDFLDSWMFHYRRCYE